MAEINKPLIVETFIRDEPLYAPNHFNSHEELKPLYKGFRFDGYCPECHKEATFEIQPYDEQNWFGFLRQDYDSDENFLRFFRAICTREPEHIQHFLVRFSSGRFVTKVGQHPSQADIEIEANRKYRSILEPQDANELNKAIGLAAHGVGIGSFVYLRRIFERLVYGRFSQFKDIEKWDEAAFQMLRMDEKVGHLKGHLPSFLVENKRMYGILSSGIHSLDERACLGFFPILLKSIGMILEEDKKAKEEALMKDELKKAINAFEATSKKPKAT